MKTKSHTKDKYNVITLGCSKNLVDSEVLVSQLKYNTGMLQKGKRQVQQIQAPPLYVPNQNAC